MLILSFKGVFLVRNPLSVFVQVLKQDRESAALARPRGCEVDGRGACGVAGEKVPAQPARDTVTEDSIWQCYAVVTSE